MLLMPWVFGFFFLEPKIWSKLRILFFVAFGLVDFLVFLPTVFLLLAVRLLKTVLAVLGLAARFLLEAYGGLAESLTLGVLVPFFAFLMDFFTEVFLETDRLGVPFLVAVFLALVVVFLTDLLLLVTFLTLAGIFGEVSVDFSFYIFKFVFFNRD